MFLITSAEAAHPDNNTIPIGVSLGTWNGVSCAIVIANDNISPGSSLTGRATAAGNLCVRVYDVGFVPGSSNYEAADRPLLGRPKGRPLPPRVGLTRAKGRPLRAQRVKIHELLYDRKGLTVMRAFVVAAALSVTLAAAPTFAQAPGSGSGSAARRCAGRAR